MKKIVLASSSPRRKRLLDQLDIDFIVAPSNIDETKVEADNPKDLVQKLSYLKAKDIACKKDGVIIGADTIVELEDKVLEKPVNIDSAYKMLNNLSGTTHRVLTGVTIIADNQSLTDYKTTDVTLRRLSNKEIKDYIATGEPMDKAGGYGIQSKGAIFVEKIEGSFYNVVGLPLTKLVQMLQELGIVISFNE
ncbi:MAF protein [Halobacteroides halobius DSM 5150]|uniref:dTTP/UTP pyrophosphatase n=1 Tax=Halobacteroides halobius (strain ATCC 35273 / DSM 5150 / MD-1) TaxID=748449 RepID=L0KA74_HALHC|nr:Maf family protein [Halobacteroides halobius]AGB41896.1 MAF protein [Halobacteroides halobius DSM 5150]